MQLLEATKLARDWEAQGMPACEHPHVELEFYLEHGTGCLVCTTCGQAWSTADWHDGHGRAASA